MDLHLIIAEKMMCLSPVFPKWPWGFYAPWGQGLSSSGRFRNQEARNLELKKSVELILSQGFCQIEFLPHLLPHPCLFCK